VRGVTIQPPDASAFRGVFPVLVTPFDDSGAVDTASLERCVEFCIEADSDGLVALVNAGEFTTLTENERRTISDVIIGTNAGSVPVVVGVSAPSTQIAVGYAKAARAAGADAVVAMPPYMRAAVFPELVTYFGAVADAAEVPVFVQTYHRYPATALPIDVLGELAATVDGVQYVKEEILPAGQRISQLIGRAGQSLKGVMGGFAGRFVIDEYLRGSCGTMPACEVIDVHVAIWRALESGDIDAARDLHTKALPLLNIEYLYGPAVYKEVLRLRGVIATSSVREPGAARLDPRDLEELDAILGRMGDMFTGRPPVPSPEAREATLA
jgi:dihydrodipicolinate synthase/N-acetylneuraminate lyase